ncbi:MAG: GrpB family protein [Candidatus Paceibacterota bacterium]
MNNSHSYKNRKYEVVPYDVMWPKLFENYSLTIKKIFGNVSIEHIGSTSIPGMSGKSCIDILVIVKDLSDVEKHIEEMKQSGFDYSGEFVMKNSRLFRVVADNVLYANVHFFPEGHIHNKEMLDLRDYLRNHPEEVEAYSVLKKNLYIQHANDYALYRKYKDEYMNNLMERVAKDKKGA